MPSRNGCRFPRQIATPNGSLALPPVVIQVAAGRPDRNLPLPPSPHLASWRDGLCVVRFGFQAGVPSSVPRATLSVILNEVKNPRPRSHGGLRTSTDRSTRLSKNLTPNRVRPLYSTGAPPRASEILLATRYPLLATFQIPAPFPSPKFFLKKTRDKQGVAGKCRRNRRVSR